MKKQLLEFTVAIPLLHKSEDIDYFTYRSKDIDQDSLYKIPRITDKKIQGYFIVPGQKLYHLKLKLVRARVQEKCYLLIISTNWFKGSRYITKKGPSNTFYGWYSELICLDGLLSAIRAETSHAEYLRVQSLLQTDKEVTLYMQLLT